MDWARDNAFIGYGGPDPRKVFRYQARTSIVVKITAKNDYRAQIWPLETETQWREWLDKHCNDSERGLIIILARRSGEPMIEDIKASQLAIGDWLAHVDNRQEPKSALRRTDTFAVLDEKTRTESTGASIPQRQGSIRDLPFSQNTFDIICKRFQVHESIVRAVSRADVPAFSCERVNMTHPAFVYNYRTPNAWESDLAMSATHYPTSGLTYALVYGCTLPIEGKILQKLRLIRKEAAHPLLVPGLLSELELSRHTRLVESSVTEVENKILELNIQPERIPEFRQIDVERRNEAKRTAWLDLRYLGDSIATWRRQIEKMMAHAEHLDIEYSSQIHDTAALLQSPRESDTTAVDYSAISSWRNTIFPTKSDAESKMMDVEIPTTSEIRSPEQNKRQLFLESVYTDGSTRPGAFIPLRKLEIPYDKPEVNSHYLHCMQEVGRKIGGRLSSIRDEYDEKIRDCTMRVDGMAMATQWSHSETAVEVALAARQDSRVMRSISLVTMVFLPGTFFATVFSMTFFDWSDSSGGARVSSYLWIYVAVTVFFTAITIGLWYYFIIYRRMRRSIDTAEVV